MTVFTRTGQLAQRLARGMIHRLWVEPLETRVIPHLAKANPGRVQSLLLKMSTWSANAGRVLLEELRLSVIRWVGRDWSVTYIGNGFSVEVLKSIFFPGSPEARKKSSQIYLWQVPKLVRRYTGEGDLVVCELNRIIHLSSKGMDFAFTTPQWIKQVIERIDRPVEEILASFDKDIRGRIRRLESRNYDYRTTHSEADFEFFYYRMHLPYLIARHGGRGAIVQDFDFIHSSFEKGALLMVQQDGEPICGSTFQFKGNTCEGLEMGVIDGRVELVKQGANMAMWWYLINTARQQGARRFDLGGSRPLISDGSFTFKRQWGTELIRFHESYGQWNFFGRGIPPSLRDHLNGKGFITEISGNHYQVILLDPDGTFDEAMLAKQLKNLSSYGLAGVVLLSGKGEQQLITCTAVEVGPDGYLYLALDKVVVSKNLSVSIST